jgi:diadenylate cyclase
MPGIVDLIDIAIVAFVLYWVMALVKSTRAEKMLWGLGLIVIVYFVSGRFELLTLHWLLGNFLGSIVVLIIVVFQQDIRRALVSMGRAITQRRAVSAEFLDELIRAVGAMSEKKTGALIAIERMFELREYLSTGVDIEGSVSKELLLSIFSPGSPLHDGAVVVRNGKVLKAGCILPLTEKELPKTMGTRHRAAMGLSEETDAVIVVVSEETGDITIVEDERAEHVAPSQLRLKLKELLARRQGVL